MATERKFNSVQEAQAALATAQRKLAQLQQQATSSQPPDEEAAIAAMLAWHGGAVVYKDSQPHGIKANNLDNELKGLFARCYQMARLYDDKPDPMVACASAARKFLLNELEYQRQQAALQSSQQEVAALAAQVADWPVR